ncbi:MAG: hypothetical protein IPN01_25890 [Deltaproteobacteria bacterium]|nr:hypothetical protein [Deltaproteobacteria bacterium]
MTRITLLDDGSTSGAAALGALRTPREAGRDGLRRLFTVACARDGDAPPTPT